MTYFSNFI